MEELHELLGFLTLGTGVSAIVCGVIIYRFTRFKEYLGKRRSMFLQWHFFFATSTILFLLGHYFTTNKQNLFLITGTFFTITVYFAGFSFRFTRRFMKKIVTIKIILLLLIVIVLPIGHSMVDEHENDKEMKMLNRDYDG